MSLEKRRESYELGIQIYKKVDELVSNEKLLPESNTGRLLLGF
jgi:hypothetical protein